MSLPKQLIQSFHELQCSELVAGSVTKQTIQSFVETLNKSIPLPTHSALYALYKFNRTKYMYDQERFLNDIKGLGPYEAMILWTDFKDILTYFNLTGKMFLGWDKKINRYKGFISKTPPPPTQSIQILRRGEKIGEGKSIPVSELTETPLEIKVAESMDDDMVRVYDHMQQRLQQIRLLQQTQQ